MFLTLTLQWDCFKCRGKVESQVCRRPCKQEKPVCSLLAQYSSQSWHTAVKNLDRFAGGALDNKSQSPYGGNGPCVLPSPSIAVFCP